MSVTNVYNSSYGQIKKRVAEYNIRYVLAVFTSFILTILFVFSLLPLIPFAIALYFGFDVRYVWVICLMIFGLAFWLSSKLIRKINLKYGITLEEKMFLRAYESLKFLEEYLNPSHPIRSSRMKAGRKLERIYDLLQLNEWSIPNISIMREEREALATFQSNLKKQLIPAIEKTSKGDDKDKKNLETSLSLLLGLIEYTIHPHLDGLKKVNENMHLLDVKAERDILRSIRLGIWRPSNWKYLLVLFSVIAAGVVAYLLDLNYFGAKPSEAFSILIMVFLGIITIFAAYFGATRAIRPKT